MTEQDAYAMGWAAGEHDWNNNLESVCSLHDDLAAAWQMGYDDAFDALDDHLMDHLKQQYPLESTDC